MFVWLLSTPFESIVSTGFRCELLLLLIQKHTHSSSHAAHKHAFTASKAVHGLSADNETEGKHTMGQTMFKGNANIGGDTQFLGMECLGKSSRLGTKTNCENFQHEKQSLIQELKGKLEDEEPETEQQKQQVGGGRGGSVTVPQLKKSHTASLLMELSGKQQGGEGNQ